MTATPARAPVLLADYRPTDYLIDKVDIDFRLHPTAARVVARLSMRPNPKGIPGALLRLDGDGVTALRIELDGAPLDLALARPESLTIEAPPARPFELVIESQVNPAGNTQLSGLYRSGSAYCTQCEAEGFRRITYFLDRPDVLSVFTTRIEAERGEAPILLGNGNRVAHGDIPGTSRHYAVWFDPHPKPSYLFALVGGDLGVIQDHFQTMRGRSVQLAIYVEHGKEARAHYAMDALKRSMKWDEEKFGREYDLDVFNIVAVSDFNMGAMENKGLNIFNDKYVLASPTTATDADYAGIESVIAHEYFHNWTGNRITCRDWFQLCLKEGLTVFRDQEFSSDQRSRPVKRIEDVRGLRAAQFAEDAGPLAHAVRPETYVEINNFYTATVYQKGAEVIRTLKTLIGDAAFSAGMELYFKRHDGAAATVEEFIACFADSSGYDFQQFMLWYRQAGTPILQVRSLYDRDAATFMLEFQQTTPPTPGQNEKKPLVIPVALGLIGAAGHELALATAGENDPGGATEDECASGVFNVSTSSRQIIFKNVRTQPTPSLLRHFSAPVRLDYNYSEAELLTLLRADSDLFNRWQAAQTYSTRLLVQATADIRGGSEPDFSENFARAIGEIVAAGDIDPAFSAMTVTLPGELDVAREIGRDVDPDAIHSARMTLKHRVGSFIMPIAMTAYERLSGASAGYSPDAASSGKRALRLAALDLIAAGDPVSARDLSERQFESADNMTDRIGALSILTLIGGEPRDRALARFYDLYAHDALVIDKWFTLQATIPEPGTLDRVSRLMSHPAFTMTNPNRLRALIGAFATGNPTQFNASDGSGYNFLAGSIITLDQNNPQVAARLLVAFRSWKTMEPERRAHANSALREVSRHPGLSIDTRDIIDRMIA